MQPATTADQALQNLQSFQGTQQTPEQLLNGANTSLGVPQAQQQVTGLRQAISNTTNLLNGIPSSIQGRTGNSLVTSAQANAQIGNAEAPVNTQLNKEQGDYTTANTDYEQLTQQAEDRANADLQAQTGQQSYLQNIYNDLYTKQQDTAAAAFAQQQLAEQQREANQTAANAGSGNPFSPTLFPPPNNTSTAVKPSMQPRTGGGFNFQDTTGAPISAAKYAQLTGTPLGTLLQQMASKGDMGAANAYADYSKVVNSGNAAAIANVKKNFESIFWGT